MSKTDFTSMAKTMERMERGQVQNWRAKLQRAFTSAWPSKKDLSDWDAPAKKAVEDVREAAGLTTLDRKSAKTKKKKKQEASSAASAGAPPPAGGPSSLYHILRQFNGIHRYVIDTLTVHADVIRGELQSKKLAVFRYDYGTVCNGLLKQGYALLQDVKKRSDATAKKWAALHAQMNSVRDQRGNALERAWSSSQENRDQQVPGQDLWLHELAYKRETLALTRSADYARRKLVNIFSEFRAIEERRVAVTVHIYEKRCLLLKELYMGLATMLEVDHALRAARTLDPGTAVDAELAHVFEFDFGTHTYRFFFFFFFTCVSVFFCDCDKHGLS